MISLVPYYFVNIQLKVIVTNTWSWSQVENRLQTTANQHSGKA